jgi:hypothetical protein
MKGKLKMEITQEIIDKSAEMIKGHLTEHIETIGIAFSENDEILEIKLRTRYSFNKGKFKIQTGINFVTDRIKEDSVLWYDPDQKEFDFNLDGSRGDPAGKDEETE